MTGIEVLKCDITQLKCDAIVNAANKRLLGGGGVDGAIHRSAGPELLEYCRNIPEIEEGVRCQVGKALITPGFGLPATHIIHTVGPVWRGGGFREAELLSDCYSNSLSVAEENGIVSIAFPAISCGVYGFPADYACSIATREVCEFMDRKPSSVKSILLIAYDEKLYETLKKQMNAETD